MNSENISQSSNAYQRPVTSTALKFWEQGNALLAEAEKYRRTDWSKFSALVWKGIRLQSAASNLDDALTFLA